LRHRSAIRCRSPAAGHPRRRRRTPGPPPRPDISAVDAAQFTRYDLGASDSRPWNRASDRSLPAPVRPVR
jgi:hypothetical protein